METARLRSTSYRAILRILLVTYLVVAAPVFGQPAADSGYDWSSTTEIRGEVAQFAAVLGGDAVLVVGAPDSNGATQRWTVAIGKASELRKAGITPLSLAPGTQVQISGNRSKDPSEYRLLAQKLTADNGFAWTRPPRAP